ncbi:hypothetical protein HWV62_35324 [Athelia sp. TMB]|nr:hypothetical protein HWV62_35324 [Athelia sp. TMB]
MAATQYKLGDCIHYDSDESWSKPQTDDTDPENTELEPEFESTRDTPTASSKFEIARPGIIAKLSQVLDGPTAGTAYATIHQFWRIAGSRSDAVIYSFRDTTTISIEDMAEHCAVFGMPPVQKEEDLYPIGHSYRCCFAADVERSLLRKFDWQSHRERFLHRFQAGAPLHEQLILLAEPTDHSLKVKAVDYLVETALGQDPVKGLRLHAPDIFEWTSPAIRTTYDHSETSEDREDLIWKRYHTSLISLTHPTGILSETVTVQYKLGDCIHYDPGKDATIAPWIGPWRDSANTKNGPFEHIQLGVITELYEIYKGPDAGKKATIHRFWRMKESQPNEVLYSFNDITVIPVKNLGERCTVLSAPLPYSAPHPPIGPRYYCYNAIDIRHGRLQKFNWKTHREQALSNFVDGTNPIELFDVIEKPEYRPEIAENVLTTGRIKSNPKAARKTPAVNRKLLEAEDWLEGLLKGGDTPDGSRKRKHSVSLDASIKMAKPNQSPPVTRRYDPSFADPEASIVLLSSDGISYRVHPFTLRTCSKLPQTDAKLDESSKILGRLLRMISGLGAGKWESLDDVEQMLVAAHKYEMAGLITDIRSTVLLSFLPENSLQVFLLAARYGWDEETKSASTHTLSFCIHDEQHAVLLDRNPTSYVTRLLRLHRIRRDRFKAHISRNNKCFGIEFCPCCHEAHSQASALALSNLMNSMVWEMERQPSGLDLLGGRWKQWGEYRGGRLCPKYPELESLGPTPGYGERIMRDVKVCLDALPSTI